MVYRVRNLIPKKNREGFTLIEVLLVVGLVGVIASVALAPLVLTVRSLEDSQARWGRRHNVREAADAMFRDEEWLRRYVHDYVFTSWRDVKMRCRIWPVGRDTLDELRRYTAVPEGGAYILAEKRKGGVSWQIVPPKHRAEEL